MSSREPLPGVRVTSDQTELLSSEEVYPGNFFRVERKHLRLPGGAEVDHEHLVYADAVSIIGVLKEPGDEPRLLMVEQYRSALGGHIYELPAGMVDPGENPLDCARRELEEETGYRAKTWTHVTTLYVTPGISAARMTYFLAEDLAAEGRQDLEPAEWLTVEKVPLRPLIEMMVEGREHPDLPVIVDSKAHVGLYYLAARGF